MNESIDRPLLVNQLKKKKTTGDLMFFPVLSNYSLLNPSSFCNVIRTFRRISRVRRSLSIRCLVRLCLSILPGLILSLLAVASVVSLMLRFALSDPCGPRVRRCQLCRAVIAVVRRKVRLTLAAADLNERTAGQRFVADRERALQTGIAHTIDIPNILRFSISIGVSPFLH